MGRSRIPRFRGLLSSELRRHYKQPKIVQVHRLVAPRNLNLRLKAFEERPRVDRESQALEETLRVAQILEVVRIQAAAQGLALFLPVIIGLPVGQASEVDIGRHPPSAVALKNFMYVSCDQGLLFKGQVAKQALGSHSDRASG